MSIGRPRFVMIAMCVLVLAMLASSCALADGDDIETSSVEADTTDVGPPTQAGTPGVLSPAVAPTAETSSFDASAETVSLEAATMLSCLGPRARAAQLLLPLATQPELLGAHIFAAAGELGAIGLLGSPDQALVDELSALQQSSFVPIMVASDEEGGTVQRLADLLGQLPSAQAIAQSFTPEEVRQQWADYGSAVRGLGIDVILGPVLDVGSGPGVATRSFSDDPAVVTTYGRAVAEGLLAAGVTPVFKHFPGHGRASADSHLDLPTTPPLSDLRTLDLIPYFELLADPVFREQAAVMVGHLLVPGLSDETPTSLSPNTITGLLRTELGFDGLVFTDALNMGAIIDTYGRGEALELALRAGADIVILGSLADLTPAVDFLVERGEADAQFGALIDDRASRILIAKGQKLLCADAQ